MAFDLRAALLKKQEVESARLVDFAFRLRARSWRAAATEAGVPVDDLASLIARHDDAGIAAALAERTAQTKAAIQALYGRCETEQRASLIAEVGDPSPHRLA